MKVLFPIHTRQSIPMKIINENPTPFPTFEFQKNRASLSKNATIYYDREFPENAVLGLFVFIIPFIILFFLIICVIVTFKM